MIWCPVGKVFQVALAQREKRQKGALAAPAGQSWTKESVMISSSLKL